jgi:hypothetical protein
MSTLAVDALPHGGRDDPDGLSRVGVKFYTSLYGEASKTWVMNTLYGSSV